MKLPGIPSLIFLAYILLFLPWISFRSAKLLRSAGAEAAIVYSREKILSRTLMSQAVLFLLAWFTGLTFNYQIFELPALQVKHFAAAIAAFGFCLILRWIARLIIPDEQRRKLFVYFLAPRTSREKSLWIVTILVAAIAEEAAYRGVGMSILWYSLDNGWIAALISAAAFSLGHWIQGWKSALIIFVVALVMQSLVVFAGTLVLAMIVHASYDFVAGRLIGRDAARYDREMADSTAQR